MLPITANVAGHQVWSHQKMAETAGCSKVWVKKWLHRTRSVRLEYQQVMYGLSRDPKHPPLRFSPEVVNKILEIRDHPPQLLGRTPGPLTILYYLQRDQTLKESGAKLPRSTRTVWKILTKYQRTYHPSQNTPEPEERPAPGVEWVLDFHDVSIVPADPLGNQTYYVQQNRLMNFQEYLELMCKEAVSLWRHIQRRTPIHRQVTMLISSPDSRC